MSDFYKVDLTKASKVHLCCECSGEIQINEAYHRHFGVWEGEFFTSKNCDDCELLRDDLNKTLAKEDRLYLGELFEYCSHTEDRYYLRLLRISLKRGAMLSGHQLNLIKEGGAE
jgi:hypothetical protein